MRNRLLFTGLVALTLSACGETPSEEIAHTDDEIVGGVDTPVGALPYMVGLFDAEDSPDEPAFDRQFCGGTLIDAARGLVLTAAHCVTDEYPLDGDWWSEDPSNFVTGTVPPSSFKVTIGSHRLSDITADDYLDVVEIIAHPDFDYFTLDADIAILRVQGVDPSTPTPRVIGERFRDPFLVTPGLPAVVAGWGALGEEENGPDTLQWVRLPIIDRNVCNYLHQQDEDPVTVTANMMCAGPFSGKRTACYGDSGGPLLVTDLNGRRVLAGIASWGAGCDVAWRPGVYTNVLALRPWVDACTDGEHCERMPPLPTE